MTDKKQDSAEAHSTDTISTDSTASPNKDIVPESNPTAEQYQSTSATENNTIANNKPAKKSPVALVVSSILLLLVTAALTAGGYWVWQEKTALSGEITALKKQLQNHKTKTQNIAQSHQKSQSQWQQQYQQLQKQLAIAEQRLDSHNKRLLSMSTTSREDWLLAEAEYLLKLANQRALIERKADSAIILLQEADNILRDMDNTDLFPLRQAIAKDLAALRLTTIIDREGIYLELAALANIITSLPMVPTREELMAEEAITPKANTEKPTSTSFINPLNNSFMRLLEDLKSYIRVRQHEQLPTPILPPDSSQYVQQNIRLMLERAQLAMLRQQQSIYQHSLQEATDWLTQYYPQSAPVEKFQQALKDLQTQNIEDQLPDISNSLDLLHAYIEKLHRLQPAKTQGSQL